jgi:uncharacterized coiled-coil protein SlyX
MIVLNGGKKSGAARGIACGSVLCILILGSLDVAAQNPSAGQQKGVPARSKHVWTEDDLISLRKPWDLYLIAQEKKAAEERAAREAEEDAKKAAPKPAEAGAAQAANAAGEASSIQENIPALEERIFEARKRVAALEQKFQAAERAAYNSREDERAAATQAHEAVARELEKARDELKLLEDKLQALKASQGSEVPSP